MILWRISDFAALHGAGGLHTPGRWHNKGRRVVYLSTSVAGALLEVLVHARYTPENTPNEFTLLEVAIAEDAPVQTLDESALPRKWTRRPRITRQIGDQWLRQRSGLLLKVPSAVIPRPYNYLFNPARADVDKARILSSSRHPFDPRLFKPAPTGAEAVEHF